MARRRPSSNDNPLSLSLTTEAGGESIFKASDFGLGAVYRFSGAGYADVPGFSFTAKLADMRKADFLLTPGRYVGAADEEDDDEAFADKIARLTGQLQEQFAESHKLETQIKSNLGGLGFGSD